MAIQQQNGGTQYPQYLQARKTVPLQKPAPGTVAPDDGPGSPNYYQPPVNGRPPIPPVVQPRPMVMPPVVAQPAVAKMPGGVPNIAPGFMTPPNPGQVGRMLPPGGPMIPREAPNGPIPLQDLGGVIERQLGNPSAYNSEVVQRVREMMRRNLGAEADVEASKRGTFFTTNPQAAVLRQQGDIDTALAREAALTYGQDLNSAIGNASNFGRNALDAEAQRAQILLALGQLGMQGEPSIEGAVGGMGGPLPFPQGGQGTDALMQLLGMLYGGQGNKTKAS